jgi:hypothetical protein
MAGRESYRLWSFATFSDGQRDDDFRGPDDRILEPYDLGGLCYRAVGTRPL